MCALLRGEQLDLEFLSTSETVDRFRELAAYHGIGPLLSSRIKGLFGSERVDDANPFPSRLLMDATAVELVRTRELNRVLDALADSGVQGLLLKGAALAHTIYPSPVMRPRVDTDLLIPDALREIADRVLSRLGYDKQNAVTGRLVTYQRSYAHRDRFGIDHVLDIHWRISNTQVFSRALDYGTLEGRSTRVPALGEQAETLCCADALLLACMHRVHHLHRPYRAGGMSMRGERLIWLYDMHLLLESMTAEQLLEFACLSESSQMRAVCRDGIVQTMRCFGTRVPEYLLAALQTPKHADRSERHLRGGRFHSLANELGSLPRWSDRIALLTEHLFPSGDYMLAKYSVSNRAWLPLLYVQRGIQGAWKRMISP